jgi:hypothetical protein
MKTRNFHDPQKPEAARIGRFNDLGRDISGDFLLKVKGELKMQIKIDPEFKSLIPKISEDELKGLEQSILDEGCRDPLVLWDDVILDGHNRFDICTRHEIPFKTIGKTFDNRDQAKLWIICNQLSRRNLTPEDKTYLIGIQYKLEKKEVGGQLPRKGVGQNEPPLSTAEKIAEQHHVSPATVKRAEKFADAVDKLSPEEKKEVLSGRSKRVKELKRIDKFKRNICKMPDAMKKLVSSGKSGMTQQDVINFFNLSIKKQVEVEHSILGGKYESPSKKRYLERLARAWEIIPKIVPPDLKESQQMLVGMYADKFFCLLELFFKVLPSNEYMKRMHFRREEGFDHHHLKSDDRRKNTRKLKNEERR